jgi:hypothetical protein
VVRTITTIRPRGAQIDQRLIMLMEREHAARGDLRCRINSIDKLNRKDGAMKLTSAQVERTMSQFEVQALPDNHPAVPELNELFGEHTFLLDSNGLNILEPADGVPRGAVQTARVINLANWSGDNLTKLAPHEPQPTGAIVELAASRH